MATSVSANWVFANSTCSGLTIRYVLEALGLYPKEGPRSASSFHHNNEIRALFSEQVTYIQIKLVRILRAALKVWTRILAFCGLLVSLPG